MANKVNLRICLTISIFLSAIAGPTQAATITVGPGAGYDFDTIQSGIDAATDGDTVLVAPGEYVITEPVTFRGKAITVRSEAEPGETTIRMGTPADTNRGSAVIFETNETDASILEGFTITGGRGSGPQNSSAGGGIYFGASSGNVKNCAIIQNTATYGGGVICWDNSLVTLTNCIITENAAGDSGGGLFTYSGSSTILIDCIVVENTAKNGGGVMVDSESSTTLTNCIIRDNSATGVTIGVDGYGGGLSCLNDSSVILTNCTIKGNSAVRAGGGGHFWQNSSAIMTHCNILENSVGESGGGVNCSENSSATMTNCIIRDNSAALGQGGVSCWYGSITMSYCEIIGNEAQEEAGGVYVGYGSAILTNCLIALNTANLYGGGGVMCSRPGTSLTISNCTIWGNSGGSRWGGGGVLCRNASASVTNSIIWGNTAPKGSEISVEVPTSTLIIDYSNVAGGQVEVNVGGDCTLNWGEGNIDADPLFADPNNDDFHLKSQAGRWDPKNQSWVQDDVTSPCIDAGDPNSSVGDEPKPNGGIINMGAYGGTAEASMSPTEAEEIVYIQWLGHSTVKVWTEDCVVYVDPERVPESLHDATIVCVSHTHGDHYSPSDIARVSNAQTQFIAPPDVIQQYGRGEAIAPGQTIEFDNVNIIAVPSYNTNKSNHPKSRNWVGYIIELGSKRIYVAGDTDLIEEMKSLGDIDVAVLPAGGTYTMNATEAAEATRYIQPELAIPYHWGQNVGTLSDAQTFAELAACAVKILTVGESISSDNWPTYFPLIARWKLDETEGDITGDSAGDNDGICLGGPLWQPAGGKVNGALQLDGIDDYISTGFVLNPTDSALSVFAWIKGGAAGQVIISQTDGTGAGETWLGAESSDGKLMTGLVPPPAGRSTPQSLVSESVITDGQWHHIGLVWDWSYRYLYVDGVEAAADTNALAPLKASDGGLYIGAGKNLEAGSFFWGLIDDVRVYNRALSPEDIEALVR